MSHFNSGRLRSQSVHSTKLLLVAAISVASFAVLAIDVVPASASGASLGVTAKTIASRVSAPGTWNNAIEVPGSAALNVGGNAGVVAISCSSAGNCVAGGNYTDGSTHLQAFVVSESGGTWGNAVEVPGTATLNAGGNAIVNSISCTSTGNCGAGGAYTDGSGDVQGFVVSESGGTWSNATEVIDPAAIGSVNSAGVNSISCSAAGSCSAVGLETITGGVPVGFALSETGGTWGNVAEINMTSTLGAGGTLLSVVSCTSPGNCAAVGTGVYTDAAVHGGFAAIPFTANESNGTWGSATLIPGMATLNVGLFATPDTISCGAAGNCSAGGSYTDGLANAQAFVVDESGGNWGSVAEVPGTATLNVGAAILSSVSCTSAGNCGGSGVYSTATLSEDFVVSETNGSWGVAEEVPGSSLFVGGAALNPNPISCSSDGTCTTGSAYVDTLGNFEAYVATEKSGVWGDALEVPGSATLNTAGGALVTAVSCSADSGCGIGGYYATGTQTFQALVTDMTPLFTPQASLSLTSTSGKVGTALKLTTSGGSGTGGVTFTVTNGSAKGCAVSGTSLSATSAGTCLVTATKASDGTYSSISTSPTSVSLALPAKPKTLTVEFKAGSATLTSADRSALTKLSKELIKGATITVTGFAKGNASLAKRRATAVANDLKSKAHATIKTVTSSSANSATVATTKQ